MSNPTISAVVATVRGWPIAREALSRIVAQTVTAGGEVIVGDGSRRRTPTPDELTELGGKVTWLKRPGESVFQLRHAAYRASRGAVVAVTEDHVHVAPDWIERILDAHRRFPEAGAIGGAVLNATNEKVVDWAAFFLTQGPYMPPLENGHARRISGPANVSYKRRVIDRMAGDTDQGVLDFVELPRALEGEALVADDSIRVRHHQSQGFWGTSLAEFDNGRTIAGYRRRRMERGDWLRLLGAPALPLYRSFRALRTVARKHSPGPMIVRAAPAHVWFQFCAMTGELLGYATGPGDSPKRLF